MLDLNLQNFMLIFSAYLHFFYFNFEKCNDLLIKRYFKALTLLIMCCMYMERGRERERELNFLYE